jgi:DNA-binding MarR family transcriptional regulator
VLDEQTAPGAALTDTILAVFRLNRRLLDAAQNLAAEGEITAAEWQVLGGILDGPRTVADIGRVMGMTRQSVQRVADVLVGRGLAEYRDNPAHRRSKLLACTEDGYWSIRRVSVAQLPWADRIGSAVGATELRGALDVIDRLLDVLDETPSA